MEKDLSEIKKEFDLKYIEFVFAVRALIEQCEKQLPTQIQTTQQLYFYNAIQAVKASFRAG